MARFFLPPESWTETPFLEGDEAKHLTQVLRKKKGDSITVFDGNGNFAEAILLTVSKQRVDLMLELAESKPTPLPSIILAQAIPKGKNMDLIIQKAVELGVSEIHPLITENTIVSPADTKTEKWQRNALEACKQSAQFTIPKILAPMQFTDWISQRPETDLSLVASLGEETENFRETLKKHPNLESVTLLIGPEGDLSPQEYSLAQTQGFTAITLGDLILRVETATIFCLSAVRFHYI